MIEQVRSSLEFILVVFEGKNKFVPAGKLSWDTNRDKLSQPNDVLDFHFLELKVSIENTVVELIFEGHGKFL